jgi:AcrR family transcriptional regulator
MARTVNKDRRREILNEAIAVLQRDGLGLSNTELAKTLGLKRPTLLYYFPDRAALLEQALASMLAEQVAYVVERMSQHDHPLDQLYAQITAVHAFHHGREQRVLFLTQAIATSGSKRMKRIIEIGNLAFEAHRQALIGRIRDGIERGTIAECDPAALVSLVRSVVDGLMVQRVMLDADLAPIHELLWTRLLEPLKKE